MSPEAVTFDDGDEPEPLPADSSLLSTLVSALSSMLIHLIGMITLGLWITAGVEENEPPIRPWVVYQVAEEERELELETVRLDEDLTPGTHLTMASTAIPVPASEPWAPEDLSLPEPLDSSRMALDWPTHRLSGIKDLLAPVEQGTSGTAQAVVDDYQQALDRITQELLKLLAKRKVLLVWCFDQSGSMKDDQQEIRARLQRVYAELGMTGATSSDALMTAVTSYGNDFFIHTERPTTDLEVIREAIDAVPVDPSGEEMTSSAVIRSVGTWQEFAKRQDRQIAVILVTDESGNRRESDAYLEAAIGHALAARAKIYVLGREAVFGYPRAYVRWVHPQTGQVYELPLDRGPETALFEVLQSDGFGPRSDTLPSGFGPYAQSRLAWRTGGIFFMLPSAEPDLIGGENRRYEWQATRPYRPDLRSREEILAEAQRHPLHLLIWKIVDDLDPNQPKAAKMMNLRESFAAEPMKFRDQIQEARLRADLYFTGLQRAVTTLDAQQPARDREPSRRWQANYDLLRAQSVAYAVRVHLYGAALDEGAKKLIVTPTTIPPDKQLVGWRIRPASEAPGDEAVVKMLERSKQLYLAVIANHPKTPWGARAEWELHRDFNGVELVPEYRAPPPEPRPGGEPAAQPAPGEGSPPAPTIPVPKL